MPPSLGTRVPKHIGVYRDSFKQHRRTSLRQESHVGVDYDKIERTASIGVSDLLPIGLTGAGSQNVERPSRCCYSHQQRFGTPRHVTSSAASGAPTQRDGHPGQPSPR